MKEGKNANHEHEQESKPIEGGESVEGAESLESLAADLQKQSEEFSAGVEMAAKAIAESEDLDPVEKVRFESEMSQLKNGLEVEKTKLVSALAETSIEAVEGAKNLKEELLTMNIKDAVVNCLNRIRDRFRGTKGVDFILANAGLVHAGELLEEWEKRKRQEYLQIPKIHFPASEKGLEVMRAMMRTEPKSMYQLENLIGETDMAFALHKKGVSIKTLARIDFDAYRRYYDLKVIAHDEDVIAKLRLLDRTNIGDTKMQIELNALQAFSMETLSLIAENEYVDLQWDDWFYRPSLMSEAITEENLKKLHEFDPGITSLTIREFIAFVDLVSDLPKKVQALCREQLKKNRITFESIGFYNHDLLKSLPDEKAEWLKILIDKGVVYSLNDGGVAQALSLRENIFDRCKEVNVEIMRTSSGYQREFLSKISDMNEEEFALLKRLDRVKESYIGKTLERFTLISSSLTPEQGHLFLDWFEKSGEVQNLDYFAREFLIEKFRKMADIVRGEKDINLMDFVSKAFGRGKLSDSLNGYYPEEEAGMVSECSRVLNHKSHDIVDKILSERESQESTFRHFDDVRLMLGKKGIDFTKEDMATLFDFILKNNPKTLLEKSSFPFTEELRKRALDELIASAPIESLKKFDTFEQEFLQFADSKEESLNALFLRILEVDPLAILRSKNFPLTNEQAAYLDIFKQIQDSPSREMKNLAREIAPLVAQYDTSEKAAEALKKIEEIFLTNNIPLVGKQFKVFEILYPNERLTFAVSSGKVQSLKELHNSGERKLLILKDLIRAHIASADTNLERYLLALKEGSGLLDGFESGSSLSDENRKSLKLFLKKINVMSGNAGRDEVSVSNDLSEETIRVEINDVKKAFGAREGEGLIEKFERTYLQRAGVESVDSALNLMNQYRDEATARNEELASSGTVVIEVGDFVKNVSSTYLDTYLDKGIYAPEFIGAESHSAAFHSKKGDSTPLDTDVTIIDNVDDIPFNSEYGDIQFLIKKKDQFEKDGLDVFKTGVIHATHYGIRTGFGSTEIDAVNVGRNSESFQRMDMLKYLIAKKGIYIPLYGPDRQVLFTKEEFDAARKIFAGIDRFHGEEIVIDSSWKGTDLEAEILASKQTKENIDVVKTAKESVITLIQEKLSKAGISLHKGKYDDSLKGAVMSDTGSTGRGSSLDEKLDFDFAIKLDDTDWPKSSDLITQMSEVFPLAETYTDKQGMHMFRSKDVVIDGVTMTIDIGFVRKSDIEEFAAHDALNEKYESVRERLGDESYLDVLTNIRFAKKKLKEAGCYKKGVGDGMEGGLGGIGVEYWILHNDGNALKACKEFASKAYADGKLVPFEEFKKSYKVFSAGQNLRGEAKVENFTDNMSESGYVKMAQLALSLKS